MQHSLTASADGSTVYGWTYAGTRQANAQARFQSSYAVSPTGVGTWVYSGASGSAGGTSAYTSSYAASGYAGNAYASGGGESSVDIVRATESGGSSGNLTLNVPLTADSTGNWTSGTPSLTGTSQISSAYSYDEQYTSYADGSADSVLTNDRSSNAVTNTTTAINAYGPSTYEGNVSTLSGGGTAQATLTSDYPTADYDDVDTWSPAGGTSAQQVGSNDSDGTVTPIDAAGASFSAMANGYNYQPTGIGPALTDATMSTFKPAVPGGIGQQPALPSFLNGISASGAGAEPAALMNWPAAVDAVWGMDFTPQTAPKTSFAIGNVLGASAAFTSETIRAADVVFGATNAAPAFPVTQSPVVVNYGSKGVAAGANAPAAPQQGQANGDGAIPYVIETVPTVGYYATTPAEAKAYVRALIEQAVAATPDADKTPEANKAIAESALKNFTDAQILSIAENHLSATEFVDAWQKGEWQKLAEGAVSDLTKPVVPAWLKLVDKTKLAATPAPQPSAPQGVGQPGLVESIIPFWGSARSSLDYFQTGHPVWGTIYGLLAISDIFLLKSIAVGAGKLVARGAAKFIAREAVETAEKKLAPVIIDGALKILQDTCFVAGTPVLTPSGEKAIEDFEVGDEILSRADNSPDSPIRTSAVDKLFELSAPTVELRAGGRTIRTTAMHPFFVSGKGWVAAGELQPGDMLVGHDAATTAVQSVVPTNRHETVYNLRVAIDHTYFVGGRDWGFSLWVHNSYYLKPVGETWELIQKTGNVETVVQSGLSKTAADSALKIAEEAAEFGKAQAAERAAEFAKARAAEAAARGLAREAKVAEIVGGKVSREVVVVAGVGRTDIDVIGPAGELIGVGGFSKGIGKDALSALGKQLKILKAAAQQRGVPALMYFEDGTPQDVIDLAVKWLGQGNVKLFKL